MREPRFFVCEHCGNLVGVIHDAGVPMMCCGQKMTELIPGSKDAAQEKHFIEWIYLQTEQGGQRKALVPGAEPKAVFVLAGGDKPVAAYAYCNLHGLWKATV